MSDAPGRHMLEEIMEQPLRVRDALSAAIPRLEGIHAALRDAPFVVLLGRGSSRSAATWGARAVRSIARRPALLASPAELGWGEWQLPLASAVAIAISQSGQSREMIAAAVQARERGARLLVVTNTPDSELALLAERPEDILDCCAGPEVAVPATKSFTTSLACLFAIASSGRPGEVERARAGVPALMQAVLDDPRVIGVDLSRADRFVLAGEGYGEAVAEEGAIKLRETLRLSVASFETSEFLHGSINSSGAGAAILTIGTDQLGQALAADAARGAAERGAETLHIGESPVEGATHWFPLPAAPSEWAAFAAIVPIQLAARAAALARGLDPDRPEGLSKVTLIGGAGGVPPAALKS